MGCYVWVVLLLVFWIAGVDAYWWVDLWLFSFRFGMFCCLAGFGFSLFLTWIVCGLIMVRLCWCLVLFELC